MTVDGYKWMHMAVDGAALIHPTNGGKWMQMTCRSGKRSATRRKFLTED